MEENLDDIADHVRSTRDVRGWTQAELADLAHVSERTVRTIEAGRHVSEKMLRAVYRALGLPSDLPVWPSEVDTLLQMAGWRLASMAPAPRRRLMQRIAMLVIEDDVIEDDVDEAARKIVAQEQGKGVRGKRPKKSVDTPRRAGTA